MTAGIQAEMAVEVERIHKLRIKSGLCVYWRLGEESEKAG